MTQHLGPGDEGPRKLRVIRNRCLADPSDRGPAIGRGAADAAERELSGWPTYRPTPLYGLKGVAGQLGLGSVWYKDEGERFGLGAFKGLGGGLAVLRLVQRHLAEAGEPVVDAGELRARARRSAGPILTVAAASAGNHGRAVAWGAREFGCRAVISLPRGTEESRAAAIEALGAEVRRTDLPYDRLVTAMAEEAEREGWAIVSDTGWASYEEIPRWVMSGYTLIARELARQLEDAPAPTHLFVQAGVGGMAAAVIGEAERLFDPPPAFIAVEPWWASCVGTAIAAGSPVELRAPFGTRMGGLACGVVSTVAWPMLERRVTAAVAIDEAGSAAACELLARGAPPVHAGPSGAAGLAALMAATRLPSARRMLGLGPEAHAIVIGSETSPDRLSTPP